MFGKLNPQLNEYDTAMILRFVKRMSLMCVTIVFTAVFPAVLFCPAGAADTGPIVLKMNHQFPANTPGSKIDQWFADEIHRRTSGRLTLNIFWSNGLGEPRENLSLISRGVLDMAGMSPGYFPEELPLTAAPNSIPMAMENVCQARDIMQAFIDEVPAVSEEARALGIVPLFFHVLNPYLLVSREPITRLADLEHKRVRTWGKDLPGLIRAAGAKPVPLFLPDVYPALEKGIIDACPFSLDLMVSYNIHEVAGHVTEVILWEGPSWGVWISEAAWEKLPPDVKEIVTETAREASRKEIDVVLEAAQNARMFLDKKGVKFHPFPPSDLAAWKAASPDYFDLFIKSMTAKGNGEAARQMVDLWKTMRKDLDCP